jgi:hypothetical protein
LRRVRTGRAEDMALVLLVVLVLGVLVMFFVGFARPRKSRAVQSWIDRVFFKGERESGKAPGRLVPKMLDKTLDNSRKTLDKSAQAGRTARKKTPLEG